MARGLVFDLRLGGAERGDPVLLLHGFPQNSVMWDAVTPGLHAAGLRTVAIDQRGYSPGARPPDPEAYRMPECVADVLAVLDALELEVVHLVGHDWGANVAWALAADHPHRVATLTAVSVPHPRAMAKALLTDSDQRRRSEYVGLFRIEGTAEDVLLDDGAAALRGIFADSGLSLGAINRYVAPMLAPGALTGALNWYRAIRLTDPLRVGKVAVPTTFVWSDGDVAIGRTAAENCAGQVDAQYRFVELTGVSHWIADEAPEALTEAVVDRISPDPAARINSENGYTGG